MLYIVSGIEMRSEKFWEKYDYTGNEVADYVTDFVDVCTCL